jgi:hypothetical protein
MAWRFGAQIVGRFARDRVALEAAAFLERARRIGLEARRHTKLNANRRYALSGIGAPE